MILLENLVIRHLCAAGLVLAVLAGRTNAQLEASEIVDSGEPCNGYVEFCDRKYSNITEVTAHNSPFVEEGNPASNQALEVIEQLDDGVRMLQGQVHILGDTLYLCHSACILLNAGTLEDYLTTVADWLDNNPKEVITIVMGNADRVDVEDYIEPLEDSGIAQYLYTPPKQRMKLDDWPTLAEMIADETRVVFFLDYGADEDRVPYILEQFNHMWETPFSPTDPSFPCTVQRPSNLSPEEARDRLYMANHNLNLQLDIRDIEILVPNFFLIEQTNAESGFLSLGQMAEECTEDWGRPPNFLLVDYYERGDGSVFEVAARMNNVEYTRDCCGDESVAEKVKELSCLWMVAACVLTMGVVLL